MFKNNLKFICIPLLFGLFQSVMAQEQDTLSFQDEDGVNGYNGTLDTWIDAAATTTNFGTDNELNVDGGGGTSNESTLLSWDLTDIPIGSTINGVEITFNVTNSSTGSNEIYEMKRSWVEDEATWNEYAAGQGWQTVGGNGSEDRGMTILGTIPPSGSGLNTISLNSSGVAMVQSWIDNPSTNHGFIIMNYSNSDGYNFSSREAAEANRPKITVYFTPPGLTLISPNGGEIWEAGSMQDITWSSAGTTSGTVRIEYSTDNGMNWNEIIASTDDDGIYTWNVPAISTSQALVRISDTDVNGPSVVSEAVFIITTTPLLLVTSPNGGENWEGSSLENITWSSFGTSGMVKIEFSADNGLNWSDVIDSTPDDGIQPWTVPDTSSSQALVRISDFDGNGPSDNSDAVFTITPIPPEQGEPITFSATGDIPYGSSEVPIFKQQIAEHNLYSPSEFFVHLGDIKAAADPCDESYYSSVANDLKELAVPVFIVPGDNETTDCSNEAQAWAYWEQYFMDFELNFCGAPLAEKQVPRPENFAFVSKGVLFIGINLVSGVSDPIMNDDADWVEQQLQDHVSEVRGAVIFSQCGPSSGRDLFFDNFFPAAQTFAKPILFLHGDGHTWEFEYPFVLSNVVRVQVDNGAAEDPVQITVTMDPQNIFVFLRDPFSNNPQVFNVIPCVEAGSDQQIDLASSVDLQGNATDDGVPTSPGTLTTTWSKFSGPGNVIFNDPNDLITSASFSLPGNYILRLTADDGALQNYDDIIVEVSGVLVEAKIFLEGPYNANGDTMKTDLNDNNFIPTTSPYSDDPRSVTPPIPQDITDWVLVQLRETDTGAAVASKSAFLRNDGRIVADDGVTQTIEMDVGINPYYIVIKHRNHLAVMSANTVQLGSASSTLYDFTTGTNKYYGSDAKQIEINVFGMYKGDANGNSFVNSADYLKVKGEIGSNGFYISDCNLNAFINSADYLNVKPNIGTNSQVP